MRHVVRRDYVLHFRKCSRASCQHCFGNIKHPEALKLLEKLDPDKALPQPVFLKDYYAGDHYASIYDLLSNEELLKLYKNGVQQHKDTLKKNEKLGRCYWCAWNFSTITEKKRHKAFCP